MSPVPLLPPPNTHRAQEQPIKWKQSWNVAMSHHTFCILDTARMRWEELISGVTIWHPGLQNYLTSTQPAENLKNAILILTQPLWASESLKRLPDTPKAWYPVQLTPSKGFLRPPKAWYPVQLTPSKAFLTPTRYGCSAIHGTSASGPARKQASSPNIVFVPVRSLGMWEQQQSQVKQAHTSPIKCDIFICSVPNLSAW